MPHPRICGGSEFCAPSPIANAVLAQYDKSAAENTTVYLRLAVPVGRTIC